MNRDYLDYFPKKNPYPNQLEAMDAIHEALVKQKFVLFEGACGTGKTLTSLAPALDVAKKHNKTVVIATNVHEQMAQFIDEAREIRKQKDIKVVVLKGKMLMCPKPDMDYDTCSVLRDNTYKLHKINTSIIESVDGNQIKKLKEKSCIQLLNTLYVDTNHFQSWLFSCVRTPEDVADWAKSNDTCGYELLKRHLKEADLLICNYHHLLNEDIRNNVLRWIDKEMSDIILIFDEAHNIESAARSHSSIILPEFTINTALEEVKKYRNLVPSQDVEIFLRVLLKMLKSTYNIRLKLGEREKVGTQNWYDLRIADPEERVDMFRNKLINEIEKKGVIKPEETIEHIRSFGLSLDAYYEEQFKEGKNTVKKICSSLSIAIFLSDYLKLPYNNNYYPIMGVKKNNTNNEIYGRLELFACIPTHITAPLFNSSYSSVLMSATLAPFDMIKKTLGLERECVELAFEITFPEEKRLTIPVSVPPLFAKNRDNPHTKKIITQALNDIIEQSNGNVLIFFPSSYEAKKYRKLIDCNVPVYLDKVGNSAQKIREEFFELGENGKKAVLMSYLWGTLAEGVDYNNGRGRTVVIVGVGYPALNDRTRAVEAAYDSEFGNGWDYAIQIPTIRKVRQALGRVVRSPNDYGARILLDERYMPSAVKKFGKYSVFDIFPKEERDEFIDVAPERVKYSLMNFFSNIKKLKHKHLTDEIEKLQMESTSIIQNIETLEKNNAILEAKEEKERWKSLIQDKEKLQIENKQLKSSSENIKISSHKDNIKIIEEEIKNSEQLKNDLNYDIDEYRKYKSNLDQIDEHPSWYPSIIRSAKSYGIFGKSLSELKNLIEIKVNELNSINSKEHELKLDIYKAKDNLKESKKCDEIIYLNYERIEEIDCLLNSIDIQKIEKIDDKTIESLNKNELIYNI